MIALTPQVRGNGLERAIKARYLIFGYGSDNLRAQKGKGNP